MKRVCILVLVIVFSALLIQGCGGGGSSASPNLQDPGGPGGGDPGGTPPPEIGELGDLIDLGDLVYPLGDHWYFTWARVINDEGTVIGQSNRGSPVRAAFKWEPGPGEMTFLGIHVDPIFSCEIFPPGFLIPIYSEAVDINASGTIIGNSSTGYNWPDDNEKRAFLWENTVFTDLHPPGPIWSETVDINNNGEVVVTLTFERSPGTCDIISGAFYWDGETYITVDSTLVPDYQGLGGVLGESAEAVAINENGQAIVNAGDTVIFHDLNWGVIEVLNQLPCDCIAVARDINDSGFVNKDDIPDGHVIGNSGCFDRDLLKKILDYTFLALPEIECKGPTLDLECFEKIQGFFWDGGAMHPVDHLGGGNSVAADINNKDQVVGGALTEDGKTHAFLWTLGPDEKGVIRDLGTLGGDNSFSLAINEAGQVVGWAETGEFYNEQAAVRPVRHACLWEDGQMYDLGVHNDFYDYSFIPSYPVSYAVDINEQGILHALTGNSVTINEHPRGFFLSPEMP
jgi:probable HAF family extracellular repeat protein